jgi:outer membrane immunogenic protein
MKRLSFVLLAATSLSFGAAHAADMSLQYKAPVAAPAPWSWAGFYVGANVGAGWGTTEATADVGALLTGLTGTPVSANLPVTSQTLNGFLGGFQGGYNWQFGSIVAGIEGDFEWSGIEGTAPCVVVLSCNTKHEWFGDITGRLGVVAFDKALIYLKGGVAWTDNKVSIGNSLSSPGLGGTGTIAAMANANTTLTGGLLGLGAEYAFLPNWSAKLEYNFMDFGKTTTTYSFTTTPAVALAGVPITSNDFVHVFKGGINYRW